MRADLGIAGELLKLWDLNCIQSVITSGTSRKSIFRTTRASSVGSTWCWCRWTTPSGSVAAGFSVYSCPVSATAAKSISVGGSSFTLNIFMISAGLVSQ